MSSLSLQRRYAPSTRCFGCGPSNEAGLRLESYPLVTLDALASGSTLSAFTDSLQGLDPADGPWVIASWEAAEHHEAFPGMLSGGIAGTLLDCHSNWTAAWHLMQRDGLEAPPCTVTAEYAVRLKRPTPTRSGPLTLRARVVSSEGNKVVVEASLTAAGKICASCLGTFVAVTEGHPAYNRWG